MSVSHQVRSGSPGCTASGQDRPPPTTLHQECQRDPQQWHQHQGERLGQGETTDKAGVRPGYADRGSQKVEQRSTNEIAKPYRKRDHPRGQAPTQEHKAEGQKAQANDRLVEGDRVPHRTQVFYPPGERRRTPRM